MRISDCSSDVCSSDLALVGCSAGAFAQDYPTGPIRLIIGYNPGGSVDIVSRLLAERLSEELGQQVVVENKPGGGPVIASEAVVRAQPDGYTLMNEDKIGRRELWGRECRNVEIPGGAG